MILQDIKRMFNKKYFLIAYLISMAILLRPFGDSLFEKVPGTFMQILSTPLAMSDYTPFAAIFCVLPFADSFCEDVNSGYCSSIVVRAGIKRYAGFRCLTVMFSGGVLTASVFASVILICALKASVPETIQSASFMKNTVWMRMGVILLHHGVVLAALRIVLAFLFGAAWALIGLMISTLSMNQYVTYIAPFILYQLLWFLMEGSPFNPVYMLRGDSEVIPSFVYILCFQTGLILLGATGSYIGITKRITIK